MASCCKPLIGWVTARRGQSSQGRACVRLLGTTQTGGVVIGAGVPRHLDGALILDVRAEVAVVVHKSSGPLGLHLLAIILHGDVIESHLLVGGVLVTCPLGLLKHEIGHGELLGVAVVVGLDGNACVHAPAIGFIHMVHHVGGAVLVVRHGAVQHITGLHSVCRRVDVVLRGPLEVFVVDLPVVASPWVHGLCGI